MNTSIPRHAKLTIGNVKNLGRMLIETSNIYPTKFLTERDFFPLVYAYLKGVVPKITPEMAVEGGKVDFRFGGTNPTLLELAVQPRILVDANYENITFPGHASKTSLYASQNKSELNKLILETQGKTRFLLLIDFHGGYDIEKLELSYKEVASNIRINKSIQKNPVRVVFASQNSKKDIDFCA
jgi:hypothetical protein